jgi:hypothetical protein
MQRQQARNFPRTGGGSLDDPADRPVHVSSSPKGQTLVRGDLEESVTEVERAVVIGFQE